MNNINMIRYRGEIFINIKVDIKPKNPRKKVVKRDGRRNNNTISKKIKNKTKNSRITLKTRKKGIHK